MNSTDCSLIVSYKQIQLSICILLCRYMCNLNNLIHVLNRWTSTFYQTEFTKQCTSISMHFLRINYLIFIKMFLLLLMLSRHVDTNLILQNIFHIWTDRCLIQELLNVNTINYKRSCMAIRKNSNSLLLN